VELQQTLAGYRILQKSSTKQYFNTIVVGMDGYLL
jgi:hypothetical protein